MTTLSPPPALPGLIGYQPDPTAPPAGLYSYTLHGGGLVLRAARPEVIAILPLAAGPVRGLPALTPGVTLQIPRLPAAYLTDLLAHFAAARDGYGRPLECLVYLGWNGAGWWRDYPPQHATPISVQSTAGPTYPPYQQALLEIHSHHRMAAFWSPTDDHDEQGFRFYGVIGARGGQPCLRLRLGVYGIVWEIDPATVCELPAGLTTLPARELLAPAHDLAALRGGCDAP